MRPVLIALPAATEINRRLLFYSQAIGAFKHKARTYFSGTTCSLSRLIGLAKIRL